MKLARLFILTSCVLAACSDDEDPFTVITGRVVSQAGATPYAHMWIEIAGLKSKNCISMNPCDESVFLDSVQSGVDGQFRFAKTTPAQVDYFELHPRLSDYPAFQGQSMECTYAVNPSTFEGESYTISINCK